MSGSGARIGMATIRREAYQIRQDQFRVGIALTAAVDGTEMRRAAAPRIAMGACLESETIASASASLAPQDCSEIKRRSQVPPPLAEQGRTECEAAAVMLRMV